MSTITTTTNDQEDQAVLAAATTTLPAGTVIARGAEEKPAAPALPTALSASPVFQRSAPEKRLPLPKDLRMIERRIQFSYHRIYDNDKDQNLSHWAWRSTLSDFSARIYPDLRKDTITIEVFDELTGQVIREWSGQIRMTGDWRRRLSRSAGEAIVLAQMRPWCPKCSIPLTLRERHDKSCQFFGCINWPRCDGSYSIIDHDLERKKAAGHSPTNVHQQQQRDPLARPIT